jgi:hypothetical protein
MTIDVIDDVTIELAKKIDVIEDVTIELATSRHVIFPAGIKIY